MLELALRLLVTAVGVALPTLLARVALPGVDEGLVEGQPRLSIGALGLDGVLVAFVGVEIVAALMPRWRPLRRGPGRVQLMRATFVVATALVVAQALLIAWALRRSGTWEAIAPGLGPTLLDAAALVAGTVALLVMARVVTRWGTGHGLSVVVVLGALPYWLEVAQLGTAGGVDPETLPRTLVLVALGTVLLVGREMGGERLPVVGLVPILAPGWCVRLVLLAGVVVPLEAATVWLFAPSFAGVVLLMTVLALGLAFVGGRGRTLAELRARGPAIALSAALPALILAADRMLGWDVSFLGAGGGLAFFVLAVTCALDVLREASLRSRVALVPILAFADLEVVDRVGRRLAEADIAHVMRGVGHRTLLRFFGPWVPVKLLVDETRIDEASRLARAEANREAYEEMVRAF